MVLTGMTEGRDGDPERNGVCEQRPLLLEHEEAGGEMKRFQGNLTCRQLAALRDADKALEVNPDSAKALKVTCYTHNTQMLILLGILLVMIFFLCSDFSRSLSFVQSVLLCFLVSSRRCLVLTQS